MKKIEFGSEMLRTSQGSPRYLQRVAANFWVCSIAPMPSSWISIFKRKGMEKDKKKKTPIVCFDGFVEIMSGRVVARACGCLYGQEDFLFIYFN